MKKITLIAFLLAVLAMPGLAAAEIERTVDPFSGAVTYTSKQMVSDDGRNMHSIALVRTIKLLRGANAAIKRFETDTYFLLNFALQGSTTLGDTFDVRISQDYINALPLAPVVQSTMGMATVGRTARTGHKELLEMTVATIEKGEELVVRVNFSRGSATYSIPAEKVKEWAELIKITGEGSEASKKPNQQ